MTRPTTACFILSALALCFASVMAQLSAAPASATTTRYALEIPAQNLESALQAVALAVNGKVLYRQELLDGKQSPPLHGEFTAEEAIQALLAGSGLTYEFTSSSVVLIRGKTVSAEVSAPARRLAQTDTQSSAEGSEEQPSVLESTAENPGPAQGIPEILVRGARSLNTDIARSRDGIQPHRVFDRNAIEKSGAGTVEEFLRSRFPGMSGGTSNSQIPTEGSLSSVDLRGLGTGQTLILIDGRRMAGFAVAGGQRQADLNGIPASAIERIEILANTASGIYGGGATGGVVNIVLRRDYRGVEATLTHEATVDGGGGGNRAGLSAGFDLGGGRTTVMLVGSYSDADPLYVGDRRLGARARALTFQSNPAGILNGTTPPLGRTTNIRSTSGAPLTLKSAFGGGSLGAFRTFVPEGYEGPASDNGAQLVANAGRYNLDLADTAQRTGARQSLLNAPTIGSAMATVRHEFTDRLQGFVEVSASNNSGEALTGQASGSFVLPVTAAGNPFNEQVRVNVPLVGADEPAILTMYNRRAVAGVIAKLPGDWQASLDHTFSRNRYYQSNPGSTLLPSALADVRSGTVDVFRDVNMGIDFSTYLLGPALSGPVHSKLHNTAVRFAGPLPLELPAGAINISMLMERSRESYDTFTVRTKSFDSIAGTAVESVDVSYPRAITTNSFYVETLVPLVSSRNALPWLRTLDLQLAGRYDDYRMDSSNQSFAFDPQASAGSTGKFSSVNPTVGLRLSPLRDVTLRATFQTGFNPPSLVSVAPGTVLTFSQAELGDLVDLRRGGEPLGLNGAVDILTGGNSALQPEESESGSAGVILTPHWIAGLRISMDWMQIDKQNNVFSPTLDQPTIDAELVTPGLIERGPPQDGYPVGPIVSFNNRPLNLARQKYEAYDFAVDYRIDLGGRGRLGFAGNATHNIVRQEQLLATRPFSDLLGTDNGLKWNFNAAVTWERGALGIEWFTQYYDSSWLRVDHSVVANQGSATVPRQTYHDLTARYRFAPGRIAQLDDTEIQLGVRNIFNTQPPVNTVRQTGYASWADPRLATYWLRIRKGFGR